VTRIPAPLLLLLLGAAGASGQTSFDAVSIRPSNFVTGHMRITMTGGPGTDDPGRVIFTNYVLSDLITKAYGFDITDMSGPDWLMNPGMNSPRFDITAKLPDGATAEQFQLMLRDMLASRFKMAVHREAKERPIFNLVAGKNGLKLKQSVAPSGADTQVFDLALDRIGAARIHAVGVSMETLAARLSKRGNLGRPVRDATGPVETLVIDELEKKPTEN